MAPMRVESGDHAGRFLGRLTTFDLDSIVVSRASSTAAVIHRAGQHALRFASRHFVISMPAENGYRVRTATWEQFVPVNGFLLTDSSQTGIVTHSGCTVHTLQVPEKILTRYIPDGASLVGTVVPGDQGPGAIAAAMMRALLSRSQQRFCAGTGNHLMVAMLHAIAAAYADAAGVRVAPSADAATRRAEILQHVETHLSDPNLSVQSVAREFGLSDRYVRSLFGQTEEPLSVYIRRRRLDESARQLRDPLSSSLTVSDIAFRWGFNSLGSYDRAFRARYSTTPRTYRQRAFAS